MYCVFANCQMAVFGSSMLYMDLSEGLLCQNLVFLFFGLQRPHNTKSHQCTKRNRFFYFSSVFEKNLDSVQNEFGSVEFEKMQFGFDIIEFTTYEIDDVILTSLTTTTTIM